MGAFLEKPIIDKRTISGKGQGFSYAVASMQGWRVEMEDAHNVQVSMVHPKYPQLANWTFLAVFDGHAGSRVAVHSSENLLETLLGMKEFDAVLKDVDDQGVVTIKGDTAENIHAWLKEGFLSLDDSMKPTSDVDRERSGTTAVCAILTPKHIFFANLGDSRGILSKRAEEEPFSTVDHKPYLEAERDRIMKAGGSVMIQRVNGSLAVSRALGDFEYKADRNLHAKNQLVSPEPDIDIRDRDKDTDEFLVLACDGIFDVFDNKLLCQVVRAKLATTHDLETIASQVLDASISKGSRDNMTLVLVVFEPMSELNQDHIAKEAEFAKRIKEKIGEILEKTDDDDVDADRVSAQLQQVAQQDQQLQDNSVLPVCESVHLSRSIVHELIHQHLTKSAGKKKTPMLERVIEPAKSEDLSEPQAQQQPPQQPSSTTTTTEVTMLPADNLSGDGAGEVDGKP